MAYLVEVDNDVEQRIGDLISVFSALAPAYQAVIGALTLNPWAGEVTEGGPDSPIRNLRFPSSVGTGWFYYVVFEPPPRRRVRVYDLLWYPHE